MTKPYYQDDWVTLYHGDCLEVTEWLSADVLVMDPPYGIRLEQILGGIGPSGSRRTRVYDVLGGDGSPELRDEVLKVWAGRPAVVFGTWRVPRPDGVLSLLVWDKAGAFSGPANCAFFTVHEEIYILGKGDWRRSSPPLRSVITTSETRHHAPAKAGGHPTPKPVSLMEILLDRCPPGLIADPFAGSGATLVAARLQGRHAVGVELEERYCEIAAKRLAQDVLDFGAVG